MWPGSRIPCHVVTHRQVTVRQTYGADISVPPVLTTKILQNQLDERKACGEVTSTNFEWLAPTEITAIGQLQLGSGT